MIRFSFGINGFDTKWINGQMTHIPPEQAEATWEEYIDLLRGYAAIPRHPDEKERKQVPWTSPMLLAGDRRTIDNVTGLGAFTAVDLDAAGWTLDRLNDRLEGFARAFYTTTQSRPDHQRWRILLRLSREVTVHEHASIWRFLNDVLDDELDPQTHNCNRILYVPARWYEADNVFVSYDGLSLDVDTILESNPAEMPEPIQIVDRNLKTAPDGTPIITDRMVETFRISPKGGRYFHLLCSAAKRFRANGWELSASELHAAAVLAVGRHDHDAERGCKSHRMGSKSRSARNTNGAGQAAHSVGTPTSAVDVDGHVGRSHRQDKGVMLIMSIMGYID